jgi:hypothetical protein
MATRFEVEKFDGQSASFSLWRIKMKALLVQQGTSKALLGVSKKPADMQDSVFENLDAKTLSSIQLCLADDVFRKVGKEDLVADIWLKLESIYMTNVDTPILNPKYAHASPMMKRINHNYLELVKMI